jgi:hypothetical protein
MISTAVSVEAGWDVAAIAVRPMTRDRPGFSKFLIIAQAISPTRKPGSFG